MVNGLVTNAIEGIADGRGCYAFALTAKGRPVAEMRVLPRAGFRGSVREPERVWLDVPPEGAPGFRGLLARTVPPIFATVEEPTIDRLSLAGPGAVDAAMGLLDVSRG